MFVMSRVKSNLHVFSLDFEIQICKVEFCSTLIILRVLSKLEFNCDKCGKFQNFCVYKLRKISLIFSYSLNCARSDTYHSILFIPHHDALKSVTNLVFGNLEN